MNIMNNYPEIEFSTPAEIKHFQEAKLRDALQYLRQHSPFYQRMFGKHCIDVDKVRYLEDLCQIPFTDKKDLQMYNSDFLCVPQDKVIDYITTSGTLGDPVTVAMTDKDLDRLAYNEKISFICTGTQPSDIVQLMTTIDKRFMAGLAYFLGLRQLGAGIIRVGNGIPELQWDTIQRIRPNTIMCVPSFILHIIKYAEEHGIDYRHSSIKKVVCIGENLREQDFSLNLLGQHIKAKWDIDLYSTYASTEMATTFAECEYGVGGHHHPELIICEFVDAHGNNVAEGEIGEIIVTGPTVTKEYDRLPEATALAKITDTDTGEIWHRMGDCGHIDASGRLWFCGRKSERVPAPDGVIFTEQVEPIFNAHPAVRRSALIALMRHSRPGVIRPAIVIEPKSQSVFHSTRALENLVNDLRLHALKHPLTEKINLFYFNESFPVDVRHNAKIHRLALARWASGVKGYKANPLR
jgi:phenylacetate-coenzyme A ligase PaaK-like adenylate-forming protein